MKIRSRAFCVLTAASLSALSAQVAFAQAEQRFVCAVQQVVSCTPFEACERTLPGYVNLPSLIVVDLENATLTSMLDSGDPRVSPIASETETEEALVLQGVDTGVPWSFMVARSSGTVSLTILLPDYTVTGFGVCSQGSVE